MRELEAIAYISNANPSLTEEKLESLLVTARKRNQELGITGALLYDKGLFFQYLEGPPDSVAEVYEAICQSALHSGVNMMMRSPMQQRAFPNWSMGFTRAPRSKILQVSDADWKSTLQEANLGPSPSMGLKMLISFCRSGEETREA